MYNTKKRNVILSVLITLLIAFSIFFVAFEATPKKTNADTVTVSPITELKVGDVITFNETPELGSSSPNSCNTIKFVWNGMEFDYICYFYDITIQQGLNPTVYFYDHGEWANSELRTICITNITEQPNERFFEFLNENATLTRKITEEVEIPDMTDIPLNESISNWINDNFGLGISGSAVTIIAIVLIAFLIFGRKK